MTSKQIHTQRQISLDEWLTTPMGELAGNWVQEKADDLLVNVFGYKALQLGLQSCDLLQNNRIRTKVILTQDDLIHIGAKDLVTDVGGHAVVYAKHHHQRANAEGHAQNGHERYDVDEGLLAS